MSKGVVPGNECEICRSSGPGGGRLSKDLAGAGRSGNVTDKVTKFPALDQQVWQMADIP